MHLCMPKERVRMNPVQDVILIGLVRRLIAGMKIVRDALGLHDADILRETRIERKCDF